MSPDDPHAFADDFSRHVAEVAARLVAEAHRAITEARDPKVGVAATAQAFVVVARAAGLSDAQLVRFVADAAPLTRLATRPANDT